MIYWLIILLVLQDVSSNERKIVGWTGTLGLSGYKVISDCLLCFLNSHFVIVWDNIQMDTH